jgi:GT2 family glycosyltransferase
MNEVTVSVVSHGHARYLPALFESLGRSPEVGMIILTCNIPEALPTLSVGNQQQLLIKHNPHPAGFAANHNAAFTHCQSRYFAVINPDVRFDENPFSSLLAELGKHGVIGPAVVSTTGEIEDHARRFPTPLGLAAKLLKLSDGRWEYALGEQCFEPDWIAGMFMLFPRSAFAAVNGFDARYFLYYEDVDICSRLRRAGFSVAVAPKAVVVHAAHRTSRRSLRYFSWHLGSLFRFWRKHLGRFPANQEAAK